MKKIMIVDDEIIVRIGMKSIICWEDIGYTVIADCSNGVQALQAIEKEEPHLILTDLEMDKMDGFALIEECHVRYPNIKFIILSNYNDFANTRKALQLGAVDYIFKLTVTPEELIKAIEQANQFVKEPAEGSEQFLRKNIVGIKSYLFKIAIDGSYQSEHTLLQDLHKVCPNNNFNAPYRVLQISIDAKPGAAETLKTEQQMFKYGIENVLNEVMGEESSLEIYDYRTNDLAVVVNVGQAISQEAMECFVIQKFETMKEYVRRYYDLSITAALSGTYQGIAQLSTAMQETNGLLEYRMQAQEGKIYTPHKEQRQEIVQMKQYIHQHLAQDLSLEHLAKTVNMNQSYFSHLFKEQMQIGVTEYITAVRIKKASELLKNTNLKVNEISLAVGIENINYFGVVFKKVMGVSPNAYREKHLKKE